MVIGLASVIIGTSIFRKLTLLRTTTAVLIGSIIYKACVAIALRNFDPAGNETGNSSPVSDCTYHQYGEKEEGEHQCLS